MVVAGGSALGAPGSVGRPARNGRWTGRTSQGLAIALRVRDHRVVSISGTVHLTAVAGFVAGACAQPRKFSATLNSAGSGPGTSDTHGFRLWVVKDPFAWAKGRITGARTIRGTLTFQSDGSPDPCEASVHFTAHPAVS